MGTRTRLVAGLVTLALALGLLAGACGGESEAPSSEGGAALTATPPAVIPAEVPVATAMSGSPACAAGSAERFEEMQREAGFEVYCPTFLPEGYALEEIDYEPVTFKPGVTPPPEVLGRGVHMAVFTDPRGGALVTLHQGAVGTSWVSSLVRMATEEATSPEEIACGDLEASLCGPLTSVSGVTQAVFVVSDGPETEHIIETEDVDVEMVRRIAAGMLPVRAAL